MRPLPLGRWFRIEKSTPKSVVLSCVTSTTSTLISTCGTGRSRSSRIWRTCFSYRRAVVTISALVSGLATTNTLPVRSLNACATFCWPWPPLRLLRLALLLRRLLLLPKELPSLLLPNGLLLLLLLLLKRLLFWFWFCWFCCPFWLLF